jgi:predicted DNA binding CopG/RHH family protein
MKPSPSRQEDLTPGGKIRVISARDIFPKLKPTTQSISLRLPLHLLERIKPAANARDVPYQSLIKVWFEEKAKKSA